jgi:hypothetical protein
MIFVYIFMCLAACMFLWGLLIIIAPDENKEVKPAYDPEKVAQIEKELGMPGQLEYIRDLSTKGQFQYHAALYRCGSQYYLMSTAYIPQLTEADLSGPWETMVFRCDYAGKNVVMHEVVGARGAELYACRADALGQLREFCQTGN